MSQSEKDALSSILRAEAIALNDAAATPLRNELDIYVEDYVAANLAAAVAAKELQLGHALTADELLEVTADLTDDALEANSQAATPLVNDLDLFVAGYVATNIDDRNFDDLDKMFGRLNESALHYDLTIPANPLNNTPTSMKYLFAVGTVAAELTSSIKVWTEQELLFAFGSGVLKPVTTTETVIEADNITASSINIVTSANIGKVEQELIIDLGNGQNLPTLTDDERVAIASAERQDIVYASVLKQAITASFANVGTHGVITSTSGWTGFIAGDVIYISGDTTNRTEEGRYFTVASVVGNSLHLIDGQTFATEFNRVVDVANVELDPTAQGVTVTKIIVSRRDDVDVSTAGLINASAGGSIYLGTTSMLRLGTIAAGNGESVRVKAKGALVNGLTGNGINITGSDIVLEAADGGIGENQAVTLSMFAGGSLVARAADDIRLTAPTSDLLVDSIYSRSGDVYLNATLGSILDALGTDSEKIRANFISLNAAGSIGSATDLLEINVTGQYSNDPADASTRGTIVAAAGGDVALRETDGDMNVRHVTSTAGDVYLEAMLGSLLDAEYVGVVNPGDPVPPQAGADIVGRSVSLYARIAIGQSNNELEINSSSSADGKVRAFTDIESIFLVETTGDLNLDQVGTPVVDGANDFRPQAFLAALSGSILNARALNEADQRNIVSRMTYLSASQHVGTSLRRITTEVGNLEATSLAGNTFILNLGGLTVGDVRAAASGITAGGHGSVMASSPILIKESSIAHAGDLEFWAEDDNELSGLGDDDLPDDITVLTGITLEATGQIRLLAGDDLLVEAGAVIDSGVSILMAVDYQATAVPDPDALGGNAELLGTFRAPTITLNGGGQADSVLIDVVALQGNTFINGGGGDDLVIVDRLPTMDSYQGLVGASFAKDAQGRQLRDELTIDGQDGSDHTIVNIEGATSDYVINVVDTGSSLDALDVLTIEGTSADDTFLMRSGMVANLREDGTGGYLDAFERINYTSAVNGRVIVEGLDGDDSFYFDDNSAIMTVDGGAGDDFFQVGQLFATSRDVATDGVFAIESVADRFETIPVSFGFLSLGISLPAVLYGGSGEDRFMIYSNHADLRLEGEDDNDEFIIRAFALGDGTKVKLNGGGGDDLIQYNVNAPVDIDGGAGFDKIVVLGTEFADVFVITKDGVYGAGLTVRMSNAEAMEVDGLEGDDTFYVLSTAADVVTTIIGGLGSDTFNIAGDVTKTVVADNDGSQGAISHTVQSGDLRYNGMFVRGLDLTATGATTGASLDTGDGLSVLEDDPLSIDSYKLTLPDAPAVGTAVFVTVSAAQASTLTRSRPGGPGKTILVSLDGVNFAAAVTVEFTAANYAAGQTIYVKAESDTAEEGKAVVAISHSVVTTDPAYEGFDIGNVLVTVGDDDKAAVVIAESAGTTQVFENGASDSYEVSLSRAPAPGEVVTVTLQPGTGLTLSTTELKFGAVAGAGIFKWDDAQTVLVSSVNDGIANRYVSPIIHEVSSTGGLYEAVDSELVQVEVIDSATPGVEIIESDGFTSVSQAGQTDTYQMVLTAQPTADVRVNIVVDGKARPVVGGRVLQDPDGYYVVFTSANWATAVTVTMEYDAMGSDSTENQRVFSQQPHDLVAIQGPLFVEGGVGPSDRSITRAVVLPGELNPAVIRDVETDAENDLDRLNLFSDTVQADTTGLLTETRITGLNMPGGQLTVDLGNGVFQDFDRGITYTNFGVVEVLLGEGNDTFEIDGTLATTLTVVHGGGNRVLTQPEIDGGGIVGDRLTVTDSLGPVVLFGDTSANGLRYNSVPLTPDGSAYRFDIYGDDVLDASGARGIVVVDGGAGVDELLGGQSTSFMAGGTGDDHITGGVGTNWIIGDSAFDVDYLLRTVIIDDGADSAGADIITGGANIDVIIGDHGIISQDGMLEGVLDMMTFREVVQVKTTNASVGGDDEIDAKEGRNIVFGGTGADIIKGLGGQDILFGDNGVADFEDGKPTQIESIDPDFGGKDHITTFIGAPVLGNLRNIVVGGSDDDILDVVAGDPGVDPGNAGDVVLGDNGLVIFDDEARVEVIISTYVDNGGKDTITTSAGRNIVIGGSDDDDITSGDEADTLLGDNGAAFFAAGIVIRVESTATNKGGRDTIRAGAGKNIVFGGYGGDIITAGTGTSVILGDNGLALYTSDGVRQVVQTMAEADYGDDEITIVDGDHILLGGSGSDKLTAGDGNNVIIGDNGVTNFEDGDLVALVSAWTEFDGIDTIRAGSGFNTIMGGGAGDDIAIQVGNSVIFGDSGFAAFSNNLATIAFSIDPDKGGVDKIRAGNGNAIIFGGAMGDDIGNADGNSVIFGDSGHAEFDGEEVTVAYAIATAIGGADTIVSGNGNNVIFGGAAGDDITTGDGRSVVFGDSGYAEFLNGYARLAYAIDTAVGGSDTILTGNGDQIVVGGAAGDDITTGTGSDIVFGDNAVLYFSEPPKGTVPTLLKAFVISPLDGGDDTVTSGAGNDILIGGTGADDLSGGANDDRIFGDHALFDVTLPADQLIVGIYTAANQGGGNDKLYGDGGNDIIFGQVGDDTIEGGTGDDDLTGGHNILGGADGDDTIWGGDGEDVIIGDNGIIGRTIIGGTSWKDFVYKLNPVVPNRPAALIRDVVLFDHADFVGGDDEVHGGAGEDRIFGQRGDDRLYGDADADEIIGGLGGDTIDGGAGTDILLGDEGQIVRAIDGNGAAILNSNQTWHRDVVLEEVASIGGLISLSSNLAVSGTGLAQQLLGYDALLVGGALTSGGANVIVGAGAWDTRAVGIVLEEAWDDTIDGGTEDDVIFGQRGDDTLRGGAGNDTIFGDRASNTSAFATDLPGIVNAYRLISAADGLGITLPVYGQLVVPAVNLLPTELTPYLPQLELHPFAAGFAGDMAQRDSISLTAGGSLRVLAAVQGDITRAGDLYGDDTISGGEGNDTIFGDDGRILPEQGTGHAVIDDNLSGLSITMRDLMVNLSSLAFANNALQGGSNVVVSLGNDIIDGDGGDDTMFGDSGTIIVPSSYLLLEGTDDQSAALGMNAMIFALQTAFADLSYMTHAAGVQVINAYNTNNGNTGKTYNPKTAVLTGPNYRLVIGNDTMRGGANNDLVVGDNGVVVLSATLMTAPAPHVVQTTSQRKAIDTALAAQDKTLTAALAAHVKSSHRLDLNSNAGAAWLFGNQLGYGLQVGNDLIEGNDGDDILVGDLAIIQQPILLAGFTSKQAKSVADKQQNAFLKTIDALFVGNLNASVALANAFGVQTDATKAKKVDWSSYGSSNPWLLDTKDPRQSKKPAMDYITLYADQMRGGEGGDLMYGDAAYLMPIVNTTGSAGLMTAMRVLPVGETGATQAATLRYIYYYGALGKLQRASNTDVNLKPIYTINADQMYGEGGNDVMFGLLGDDYLSGAGGDDQISGGNGYDRVNGGIGTNTFGYDRTRDTAEKGGGRDLVRQTLDASSNSAMLGRNWVVPMMQDLGRDTGAAALKGLLFGKNAIIVTGAMNQQKTLAAAQPVQPRQPFPFVTTAPPDSIIFSPIDLG
ncbi:MAG: hypothetical protein IPK28_03915 [Devosia sp.]|nr:hypothetical protein [Devosia sp.]